MIYEDLHAYANQISSVDPLNERNSNLNIIEITLIVVVSFSQSIFKFYLFIFFFLIFELSNSPLRGKQEIFLFW